MAQRLHDNEYHTCFAGPHIPVPLNSCLIEPVSTSLALDCLKSNIKSMWLSQRASCTEDLKLKVSHDMETSLTLTWKQEMPSALDGHGR